MRVVSVDCVRSWSTENQRELLLGEARIDKHDGIIFNMTPSPGATSCLQNAGTDLASVCQYLNADYDTARFAEELAGDNEIKGEVVKNNGSPVEVPIVD